MKKNNKSEINIQEKERVSSNKLETLIQNESFSTDDFLMLMSENFINTPEHTAETINDYKNIFYANITNQNKTTKKNLSKMFSKSPQTPRVIALYFSMQDLLIAEPMLRFSPSLTQDDIKTIATKNPPIYAKVLKTRQDIDQTVIQHLQKRIDTDVVKDKAQKKLLTAAARGGRLLSKENTASTKHQPVAKLSNEALADLLQKAAFTKDKNAISLFIQKHFKLTHEFTKRITNNNNGEYLSVLMKSIDLNDAQANKILILCYPSIGLSVENAKKSITYYSSLDTRACKMIVESWPTKAKENVEKSSKRSPRPAQEAKSSSKQQAAAKKKSRTASVKKSKPSAA